MLPWEQVSLSWLRWHGGLGGQGERREKVEGRCSGMGRASGGISSVESEVATGTD